MGPVRPPRSDSLQQGYLLDFVDELVSWIPAASKQCNGGAIVRVLREDVVTVSLESRPIKIRILIGLVSRLPLPPPPERREDHVIFMAIKVENFIQR